MKRGCTKMTISLGFKSTSRLPSSLCLSITIYNISLPPLPERPFISPVISSDKPRPDQKTLLSILLPMHMQILKNISSMVLQMLLRNLQKTMSDESFMILVFSSLSFRCEVFSFFVTLDCVSVLLSNVRFCLYCRTINVRFAVC